MKTARDLTREEWSIALSEILDALRDPNLKNEWAVFRLSAGYQVALMQEHLTAQAYSSILRACHLSTDMAGGYKHLFWQHEHQRRKDRE